MNALTQNTLALCLAGSTLAYATPPTEWTKNDDRMRIELDPLAQDAFQKGEATGFTEYSGSINLSVPKTLTRLDPNLPLPIVPTTVKVHGFIHLKDTAISCQICQPAGIFSDSSFHSNKQYSSDLKFEFSLGGRAEGEVVSLPFSFEFLNDLGGSAEVELQVPIDIDQASLPLGLVYTVKSAIIASGNGKGFLSLFPGYDQIFNTQFSTNAIKNLLIKNSQQLPSKRWDLDHRPAQDSPSFNLDPEGRIQK